MQFTAPRLALVLGILLVPLILSATGVQAVAFGAVLSPVDPDATPWLEPLSGAVFCFIDDAGGGRYSAEDPISLHPNGDCTSRAGAVRLAAFRGAPAGRFLQLHDPDGSAPRSTFTETPSVAFVDHDNNGRVSRGDTIYIDALNPSTSRIEVGDVRVTPFRDLPGGVKVQPGDSDVGVGVGPVAPRADSFAFADYDGDNVVSASDLLFLRPQSPGVADVGGLHDPRLGGALPDTYGTWPELGEPDAPARLRALANVAVCFVSEDGTYAAGEPVVLRTDGCSGTAAIGDTLLGSADAKAGRLQAGDDALGLPLHGASGTFTFVEMDGRTGYGPGDGLYLDLTNSARQVTVGDLRMSPHSGLTAAAPVRGGDLDEGRGANEIGPVSSFIGYVDQDNDLRYSLADFLYMNADGGGSEHAEFADTRLAEGPEGFFFGSQATTAAPELARLLTAAPFEVCVVDADDDGIRDQGEDVYLDPKGCGSLSSGAVRLTPFGDHPMGSQVQGSNEVGRGTRSVSYRLSFHDADGSASWTRGDTMYIQFDPAVDRVRVGDIRLTAYGDLAPGNVGASDADLNIGLVQRGASISNLVSYYDADGDRQFGLGDVPYLDAALTLSTSASYGFVRMATLASAQEAPPGPSPQPADGLPDTEPTQSPDRSPSPTAHPTVPEQSLDGSPPATGTEDGSSARTPGPGGAFLVALLALLWSKRRRYNRQAT